MDSSFSFRMQPDGAPLGRVHSIETFGSADGPGVRFVIFLQGCHMRCRYCHNVDTWDENAEAKRMSAGELLDRAERYRPYWGTEGGITVSGGEPLLQLPFLLDLFRKAKARGISTCLDTAGEPFCRPHGPADHAAAAWFAAFEELMRVTDLLLLDIKHIDAAQHVLLTGKPNGNILDLFRYLDEIGKPVWVRHVLVPGITDRDSYLARTRAFLDTLSNVERVEVLPYHALALPKWDKLGIPYTLRDTEPPTQERIRNAEAILGAGDQIREEVPV